MRNPYSWLVPYTNFPSTAEVWDRKGTVAKKIADLPMADTVPNGGVLPGPRSFQWQPLPPATLVWVEALDNGDPKNKVPHRDQVLTLAAPFSGTPAEVAKTEFRYGGLSFTDSGAALLSENDRDAPLDAHLDHRQARRAPRKLWDRSQEDAYDNPGTPQRRERPSGDVDARCRTATASISPAPARRPEGRPAVPRSPRSHDAQGAADLPDDRPHATRVSSAC